MMWLLIAAAVIAAVVVVCLTARSRRARGTDARATATDVLATAQVCDDNKLMTDDADRVMVRLLDGNRALVFGHSTGVDTIGSTVSTLPETIAKGLIRGNAGLQAMLGAGEASSRLVMLTAESAAQLKALGPVRDAAGATLGLVRTADGRWSNILRFGQPDKLATIASLGSALSAVALQMQLAAISKQLQGIQQSVDRIEQNQDDELASSVETNLALAMADYERLQQTGRISDTQWALIAARSKSVEDNVRRLSKRLERIVSELEAVPGKNGNDSAGDRLPRIDKVAKRRPVEAIDLYMRAQQSVVLGETLHVHRLIFDRRPAPGDPPCCLREARTDSAHRCDNVSD